MLNTNRILLLLLGGMLLPLSTQPFSTQSSMRNPSNTNVKEDPTSISAYRNMMRNLNEIPSRRASKWSNILILDGEKNHRKRLIENLESCPSLMAMFRKTDSINYFKELVEVTGPISKRRLKDMISQHPYLMTQVLKSKNLRSIESQIQLDLQLSSTEAKRLLKKIRPYLGKINRRELRSLLFEFKVLDMDTNVQHKIIRSNPKLLNHSVGKIRHSISFFRNDRNATNAQVVRMLQRHSNILSFSIENHVKPLIDFMQELGITDTTCTKVLIQYPMLATVPTTKLRQRAKFLESTLKLTGPLDVAYVLTGHPPSFWLGEDTIISKIGFLRQELELEDDELRDVMVTYPCILGLSVENNILPKIRYFMGHLPKESNEEEGTNSSHDERCLGAGLTRQELKDFVLYQPSLLGYSLDKRIRPRITQMQHQYIRLSYAPPYLMSLTDAKFESWLDNQSSTWTIT